MTKRTLTSLLDFNRDRNWIKEFYSFKVDDLESDLRRKKEDFWWREGEKRALKIFHQAAVRVPAYKDFLKKNKIDPDKVESPDDFSQLPATTKDNYINKYSLADKSWDGELDADIMAVSGGTTGVPKLWPRSNLQEFEASVIHELLFSHIFNIREKSTLLVVGFPLGIYVSGVATALPGWLISEKAGYKLTLAPVGNKKDEIINLLTQTVDQFEQIILTGHPFFIKDVVESLSKKGLFKKNQNKIKFMFSSEGFSENWREYVLSKCQDRDLFSLDSAINVYGATDTLINAFETPLSILLKKWLESDQDLRERAGLPSRLNLFQFNPVVRFIESREERLLITSASGLPLIKLDIGDRGNVHRFSDINSVFTDLGKDQLSDHSKVCKWNLPFLTLLGRSDYAVDFHVAHIRPEYVSTALDQSVFFRKITGKFSLRKYFNKKQDPVLEVHIELNKDQSADQSLKRKLESEIIKGLKQFDYRYEFLFTHSRRLARPRVKLWPYQHEKYFSSWVKPRYIVEP